MRSPLRPVRREGASRLRSFSDLHVDRRYTSPASKFPAEMRDALPPSLRSLLEWELPDGDAEPDVPLAGVLPRHSSAPLTRFQPPKL